MPNITVFDDLNISVETIAHIYRQLYFLIKQELYLAKEKDKKLLIIFGENHLSSHSFFLQILGLIIAKELGIGNLYLEMTRSTKTISQFYCTFGIDNIECLLRRTPFIKHSLDSLHKPEEDGRVKGQKIDEKHFRTYRSAIKLGFSVWPVDDLHDSSNLDLRNGAMAENLKKINREGILITGFDHVPGIVEDFKLDDKYHILAINGCHLNKKVISGIKLQEKLGMYEQAIRNAILTKNFEAYISNVAQKRAVKYLEYNNAIQITFDNGQYSIFDKSGKELNLAYAVCVKNTFCHLRKPSLTNLIFDIPNNITNGVGLISNLCKKSIVLPTETLLQLQEVDRKTRSEFTQLKAPIENEIPVCSLTTLLPRKIKLNKRTLRTLSDMIKNKNERDHPLKTKVGNLDLSGCTDECLNIGAKRSINNLVKT